ncbi:hypothetical protein GOBAR_DD27926 [Gossypium barbadense]|nr:hypothetical protein GOBAR_DD27926 [Gossypium barbadense]
MANRLRVLLMGDLAKPKLDIVKINIDGSALDNPGHAGAGTIIRDHKGVWPVGSFRCIPRATSAKVELWTLLDGLNHALNMLKVKVEIDSFAVISLVMNLCVTNSN